jgi:cation diffusion facilitator family transporter
MPDRTEQVVLTPYQSANRSIRRVTYAGMLVNALLAVVKCTVGLSVGAMSLFADGIHSLSDLLTDIAVLIGIHLGSREPDAEHPYGHGRLETFATAFVAVVLIVVGGGMIYKASAVIATMHATGIETATISTWVIWISLLSVISKEVVYQWTRRVAIRAHSSVVYANAWHHRSDALSSVAVIIGAMTVKLGYPHGDQLGAIVVGLMIIWVGVKVIGQCFSEFAERAVDATTVEHIQTIIASEKRIRSWHKLRTRSAGREIFVDLHIQVDPELSVLEAHEISDSLEHALHEQMPQPVNVIVHIEPDIASLRRD